MNEPARLSTTASQACPSLPIDHGYSLFSTRNSEPVTVSGWRPTSDASGCRRPRNYFLHQAFSEALTPLYVKRRVLSGLDDGLACAEVCHDALVDLSRKEAFQASDDLACGPAIGGASGDVVAGWLVESHADDDGSIEGGVGVSVAASIEAVPAVLVATVNFPFVAIENRTPWWLAGAALRSTMLTTSTTRERGTDAWMGDEDVAEVLPGGRLEGGVVETLRGESPDDPRVGRDGSVGPGPVLPSSSVVTLRRACT